MSLSIDNRIFIHRPMLRLRQRRSAVDANGKYDTIFLSWIKKSIMPVRKLPKSGIIGKLLASLFHNKEVAK